MTLQSSSGEWLSWFFLLCIRLFVTFPPRRSPFLFRSIFCTLTSPWVVLLRRYVFYLVLLPTYLLPTTPPSPFAPEREPAAVRARDWVRVGSY